MDVINSPRFKKAAASQAVFSGYKTFVSNEPFSATQLVFGLGVYYVNSAMDLLSDADIPVVSKHLGQSETLMAGGMAMLQRVVQASASSPGQILSAVEGAIPTSQAELMTAAQVFALGVGADYVGSMLIGHGTKA